VKAQLGRLMADEGKIGRAVMTIALVAATALLVLAMAWLVGSAVQRHLKGEPIQHREAPHAPLHSDPAGRQH
jgi:hypothetical protein